MGFGRLLRFAETSISDAWRIVNDDQLREIQERAHQIRELTRDPKWAILADYVGAMISAKNRSLLNGNAKTIEEYRGEAGWISGAYFVLQAADHLDRQLEDASKINEELKAVASL